MMSRPHPHRCSFVVACALFTGLLMPGNYAFAGNTAAGALADKFSEEAQSAAKKKAEEAKKRQEFERVEAERKAAAEQRKAEEAEMLARARAEAAERDAALARAEEATRETARLAREAEALRRAEEARLAEDAKAAQETKAQADAAKDADTQKEMAARSEAERVAREAEELRRSEEARIAEEENKKAHARKLEAEAREAEELKRAEEARLAEQRRKDEDARKQAEAREAEELKRAEEARLAEASRQEEDAQKARAMEREMEREAEAQKLAEKLKRIREARVPSASGLGGEPDGRGNVADQVPEPAQLAVPSQRGVAPPERSTAVNSADGSDGDEAPRETTATIILVMEPGNKGIRRYNKTADPVICQKDVCYISAGDSRSARRTSRMAALGPFNTILDRAGACRQKLGCIFRNVRLDSETTLQPVDLHYLRHDRRAAVTVSADPTCEAAGGKLSCARVIEAKGWRALIVPETIARRAGPAGLQAALAELLPQSQEAALRDPMER